MRKHKLLIGMGLILALVVLPVRATDTPKSAPQEKEQKSELETLRVEVQHLRERVSTLEAQCPATSAQQPPPAGGRAGGTPKYLLKNRWDRLETGLEMDEVRALLGRPGTITRSAAGQVTIWGYGDPQTNRYGVGTVYFDEDDEVTTWMSPTFKTD